MTIKEFCEKNSACEDGFDWAVSKLGEDGKMADLWPLLTEKPEYHIWVATRDDVFSDSIIRKIACRFVRETPAGDGRFVWDLLTDERSRNAIVVAERHADGLATDDELEAAKEAAWKAAMEAASKAAWVAAWAARAAAGEAARAAAGAVARAVQSKIIYEFGNPFYE